MSDECLMKQETVFSFYTQYQAVMRKFILTGKASLVSALAAPHVLRVAGVKYNYQVIHDDISKVPLVGVRHVVALPLFERWLTPMQCISIW